MRLHRLQGSTSARHPDRQAHAAGVSRVSFAQSRRPRHPAGVERASGIGRNVDLFARVVSEAHRPSWQPVFASEGYGGRWLAHVEHLNDELHANYPLPKSECRSIAKSAMGYAIRPKSSRHEDPIYLLWDATPISDRTILHKHKTPVGETPTRVC